MRELTSGCRFDRMWPSGCGVVYTFANRDLPTTEDPEHDFELAAPGTVRVLPDGSGQPAAAFHALAEYGRVRARTRAKQTGG